MPIDEINEIMTGNRSWEKEGLGRTGETYLIGDDSTMRNDSRHLLEEPSEFFRRAALISGNRVEDMRRHSTTILFQKINNSAAKEALQGKTGEDTIIDYTGREDLTSYAPLKIDDLHWAIVAQIDMDEAFKSVYSLRRKVIFTSIVIAVFVGLFGWLFSRIISRPITLLINGTKELKNGNFSNRVASYSGDEIGLLTNSFNEMADHLDRMMKKSRTRICSSIPTPFE